MTSNGARPDEEPSQGNPGPTPQLGMRSGPSPIPGSQINVTITDLSGTGNAASVLKDVQNFFTSDGVKNLVICLGHHQITEHPLSGVPPSPAVFSSVANEAVHSPSSATDPSAATNECTGFPTGFFRIRAAGSNHYYHYWSPNFFETYEDGNSLCLWTLNHQGDKESQVFFINSRGNLCCGQNGAEIDVLGSAVILTHNRPRTQPWPNPWPHPLPAFSYSPKTNFITVKFSIDPVPSDRWPRPEKEWKGKEYVLAARSAEDTRVPKFESIARWAPLVPRIERRWTNRAGYEVPHYYKLAVEERPYNLLAQDLNRLKWEIEPV
ncbi:hypothetical protein CPB84DRAFT_239230 [Gymnopilus junonius]|uniref:Uncharacterized protein n=1 Tax=Gymnopilus junonius TaxID=109634 RepID=A0A9P5NXF9_GYMJU|nr:hypothetical protein CPB84DRAFT_239230 [Gymnopilus junonius]